jgi:hypothetical protein
MSAERGVEFGKAAITNDLSKVTLSFQDAGRSPAQNHRSTLPMPHAPGHVANAAEEILDEIGRRQHARETFGQIQTHYGERFFQSLAQRSGSTGILSLQCARQIIKPLARLFWVSRGVGLAHGAAGLCAQPLG